MNRLFLYCPLVIVLLSGCSGAKSSKDGSEMDLANLLEVKYDPTSSMPEGNHFQTGFSDKGAWHGYFLPNSDEFLGGFTGPYIIAGEYPVYLAKTLGQIEMMIQEGDTWETAEWTEESPCAYYPGRLEQSLQSNGIRLKMVLSFANERTALITYSLTNQSKKDKSIQLNWKGELLPYKNDLLIVDSVEGLTIRFKGTKEKWNYFSGEDNLFSIRFNLPLEKTIGERSFKLVYPDVILLQSDESFDIVATHTFTFTKEEAIKYDLRDNNILKNHIAISDKNLADWNTLSKKIRNKVGDDTKSLLTAMKAIMTLNTNRRSSAGKILSEGVVPSTFYKWFNGVWAWDSWKHSVGLAPYMPEVAKNNIRSMFDYQVSSTDTDRPWDEGMILDCIFFYNDHEGSGNWNERNSKPPLASWAVWKVFENSKDTAFIAEMFPALVRYHNWWYRNRDHDQNGICEYGCTVHPFNRVTKDKDGKVIDHRIEAAAWEGGGDNFIRFDEDWGIHMLENKYNDRLVGYSMNQESADLNAFLVAEKHYLSKMADILGKESLVQKYQNEADEVTKFIQTYMFDKETGFFYDVDLDTKEALVNRGKGPEGWIPLWAEVATDEQASRVVKNLLDVNQFNTLVPFPTAAKGNPRFNPTGYWRGPVWLSPAWFGLKGMVNYGHSKEAVLLANKLLNNADGLTIKGQAIRENYHPMTGEGLSCYNFSWSSAHILMILHEFKGELLMAEELPN